MFVVVVPVFVVVVPVFVVVVPVFVVVVPVFVVVVPVFVVAVLAVDVQGHEVAAVAVVVVVAHVVVVAQLVVSVAVSVPRVVALSQLVVVAPRAALPRKHVFGLPVVVVVLANEVVALARDVAIPLLCVFPFRTNGAAVPLTPSVDNWADLVPQQMLENCVLEQNLELLLRHE